EVADSVGQVGVDPGTAWVSGSVSTLDQTLRRKATVNQGRVDAAASFDPAAEFVAYPKDDASGLGCGGRGPAPTCPPQSPSSARWTTSPRSRPFRAVA
ncbi:hypothetical protein, partial [Aeromonas diversa]|uniref:hypothetical protein n=1 Tax=Aeromonas diversa TaxID=502790 RepID=UPI001F2195D3